MDVICYYQQGSCELGARKSLIAREEIVKCLHEFMSMNFLLV